MICAFVCTVTFAHAFIKNVAVGVDIAHESFMPTLWANPLATFSQLILILSCYHLFLNIEVVGCRL